MKKDAKVEVESKTFLKIVDHRGYIWYASINDPAAGNWVHMANFGANDGYGGREISFKLTDGTIETIKGPWQVPASWLFRATGFDVRDQIEYERLSDHFNFLGEPGAQS